MSPVFMDTVGLIALWDDTDQWHADATKAANRLAESRRRLVTSSAVLLECGNAAARTSFRTSVFELRRQLAEDRKLLVPDADEIERAWIDYQQARSGGPSIVDCLSFELMRRVGATEAFTNDRHFAEAGFTALF